VHGGGRKRLLFRKPSLDLVDYILGTAISGCMLVCACLAAGHLLVRSDRLSCGLFFAGGFLGKQRPKVVNAVRDTSESASVPNTDGRRETRQSTASKKLRGSNTVVSGGQWTTATA
jgi:hypothetical protein